MTSPADLTLSAHAIETYLYCPRRFEQRYLEKIPALSLDVQPDPATRRGAIFHQLVLWDGLGMAVNDVLEIEEDPELTARWQAFTDAKARLLPESAEIRYEPQFTIRVSGVQVIAWIDAVVTHPDGRITIYDWKIGERPDLNRLRNSPQSRIYPLAAWEMLRRDSGLNVTNPSQIELTYWFPTAPDSPVTISYTSERLAEDRDWLEATVAEIRDAIEYPLTPDRRRCRSCGYASRCAVLPRSGAVPTLSEDDAYALASGADDFDLGGWGPA